ncbi:MAG: hypothetical protein Tsb0020_25670 [Haliangiales bacterium]
MLALSILAIALVGLLGRTTSNVRESQAVAMRGVAVNLARGKMYELEAELLDEGFQELEQTVDGDFSDEGWPKISWEATIEKTELPSLQSLQAVEGGAEGEGAAGGIAGGLAGSLGGSGQGQSAESAFISSQFETISQILEESIRKVTLTVSWKVGNEDQSLVVACYFSDPAAMGRVLPGIGLLGGGAGGGGDSGRGGGTPAANPRTPSPRSPVNRGDTR